MRNIRHRTYRLKRFFREDIWTLELEELSRAKARFVKYMKVLMITIRTFSSEKIGFQAVALSFFSTMSVVPFIAIVFAVTGGLGLAEKLKEFLYGYFTNSQELIDMLLAFSQNIIDTAQSGLMGMLSALLFVWIVIWMMLSVERVFNNVWRVHKSRNIFKRMSYVIAMLLIAPFIVLVFFAGTFVYSHSLEYLGLDMDSMTTFKTIFTWVIFATIACFTFSAMYKFIPNAKVDYSNALRAAAVSGIAFTLMQYLYLETQVLVTRLNAIYGAFAAVPLFMIWLNVGWFIILIGAELSYAFQHVDSYNVD
ncbi:MAG: YihY/virulence factor BrkB family protein [Bacteroidales bacterium]|nr:YihY/virulence factor BrkB family protein [Bacteroidales bacterium]MBQ6688362.1 YihY/virulence factor BrkB family protein [Bacteroidales bacterium]